MLPGTLSFLSPGLDGPFLEPPPPASPQADPWETGPSASSELTKEGLGTQGLW